MQEHIEFIKGKLGEIVFVVDFTGAEIHGETLLQVVFDRDDVNECIFESGERCQLSEIFGSKKEAADALRDHLQGKLKELDQFEEDEESDSLELEGVLLETLGRNGEK